MEANKSIKSVILAASAYCCSPSESSSSKLLRHVEVLQATLTSRDADEFFIDKNELGIEFVSIFSQLIEKQQTDGHLLSKIFMLLQNLGKNKISCDFFSNSGILNSLYSYVCAQTQDFSIAVEQCLHLVEILSGRCKVSEFTQSLDKFLQWIFEAFNASDPNYSSLCLGILCNYSNKNLLVQSKLKALMGRSQIKTLMRYLKESKANDKVSALVVIVNCCPDGNIAKLLSKNIRSTLMLLFSTLTNTNDPMTRQRTANLCTELMKQNDIASEFSVFESEQNVTTRLLATLAHFDPDNAELVLGVLLSLSHIQSIRLNMVRIAVHHKEQLNLLLDVVSLPVSKLSSQPSILAMDLLLELCEEIADERIDCDDRDWLNLLVENVCQQLTPTIEDEKPHLSDLLINGSTTKTLKALQILNCLSCAEEVHNNQSVKYMVAQKINHLAINQVLEHQLTNNLTGLSQSSKPEWSDTGVEIVLSALELSLKLKHYVPELEKLFQTTLQDPRVAPFLASSITSGERKKVQVALRLLQESLPFPDFPSILLAERIAKLNENTKLASGSIYMRANCSFGKLPLLPALESCNQVGREASKSSRFVTSADEDNKENIQDLIAKINSGETEIKEQDQFSEAKLSQIIEIYEQKLVALVTKENQIQDLLDAKTWALSQANRLISQYRGERARSEDDTKRMVELWRQSEAKCEGLLDRVRAAEHDRATKVRELEAVSDENRNLQSIADLHEEVQARYQENLHMKEVLERNHKTLKQEYDTLKELHDMIQKHNDKLKQQNSQAASKIEDLEESKFKLLKRVEELERSVSDLTQLVEEQDKSFHRTLQEKSEADLSNKNLKLQVTRRDEDIKDLKIKVEQAKSENQKLCYKSAEKEKEMANLKQKLDKQAQTLLMIEELSNKIRGSQS